MVGKNAPADFHPLEWRTLGRREPYEETFRRCSWCGAMHPEDLVRAIETAPPPKVIEAPFGGPSWTRESVFWSDKIGYKLYVLVPNPIVGQIVECGSRSGPVDPDDMSKGSKTEPIMGEAPATIQAKWYSSHLDDDGYDDEALAKLTNAIEASTGVLLFRDNGRWMWRRTVRG